MACTKNFFVIDKQFTFSTSIMRHATSCHQCRTAKRRCHLIEGEKACRPCQERRQICSRFGRSKDALSPAPAVPSISLEVVLHMVKLYFVYIHDRPHSLFHEHDLLDTISNERADKCLVLAICAMGCRFSNVLQHRQAARELQRQATFTFSQQLETLSLSNIQTCVLIANLHAAEQNSMLEALYFGRFRVSAVDHIDYHRNREQDGSSTSHPRGN